MVDFHLKVNKDAVLPTMCRTFDQLSMICGDMLII